MYSIDKDWKEFNISLNKIDEWSRTSLGAAFSGISADVNLRFDFTEKPSQEIVSALDAMWDGIVDDTHEFAVAYFSRSTFEAAMSDAKLDATGKDYDSLSTLQRKILLNVDFSIDEMIQLIVDFPQA